MKSFLTFCVLSIICLICLAVVLAFVPGLLVVGILMLTRGISVEPYWIGIVICILGAIECIIPMVSIFLAITGEE